MPDLIHDPIVAPIFAAAALVAVLSFGFALLGLAAAGWERVSRRRRYTTISGCRVDLPLPPVDLPQPRPADVRRQMRGRQQRAVAAARRVC